MKNLIVTIILFLLLGCGQANKSLVGKYGSGKSGLPLGYDWFMGNVYSDGIQLVLNGDSSFTYTGCTILKGNWEAKNDTLFLYVETHKWKNDSLNRVGFNGEFLEVPEEPLKFKIIENGFRNNHLFDYKGKTYNGINKLVKTTGSGK